jgi:hypothetical protein
LAGFIHKYKEVAMAMKVKTPFIGNFNIPHSCVMCGKPPSLGMNWKVIGSKSNWNGKRTTTLTLDFPLCQECYAVSRDKKLANLLPWLLLPLSIFGICSLGSQLNEAFGNLGGLLLAVILFIAMLLLSRGLRNAINQQGFTPEQRERRKRVEQCAKISSFKAPSRSEKYGSIVFKFENPGFALLFSTMNYGDLSALPDRR